VHTPPPLLTWAPRVAKREEVEHDATDRCFSKVLGKKRTKSRWSHAYLALGDFRFPSIHVERERAADGKFNIVPREGARTHIVRSG